VNNQIRQLTPRECARAQGFSEHFILPKNKNQAYKQLENSVPISVIKKLPKK